MIIVENNQNNQNNQMEYGPENYEIVKCDRCGRIRPDDKQLLLWYCNDYEKEYGSLKYETKSYSNYTQIDYCPSCISGQQEKETVIRGIKVELPRLVKLGYNINKNIETLARKQMGFNNHCKWLIAELDSSFKDLQTYTVKKKIYAALEYSCKKLIC